MEIMTKLNELDSQGFFINDFIVGLSGSTLPENWTSHLVGDGYYKAQYQNGSRNQESGEWTSGNWVETGGPSYESLVETANSKKEQLMALATIAIAPLQDAVDLDDATEEELALLKKWKQYRVALSRINLSKVPDIAWPLSPDQSGG